MRVMRRAGTWIGLLAVGATAALVVIFGGSSVSPAARAETEQVEQQLRVAAQRLENGRVQFGVRVADGSGGWSDPVEPRVNWFLPSTGVANRWLSSSSLTLERVDASANLARTESFQPTEVAPVTLHTASSVWTSAIHYEATASDGGEMETNVSLYSLAEGTVDGELRVDISCDADEFSVVFGGLPSGDATTARSVRWSVDGGEQQTEQWSPWPVEGGLELLPPPGSEFVGSLLSGGQSLALSVNGTPSVLTEIDLSALRATPVYANLTACGGVETVAIGNTEVRLQAHLHQDGDDTSGARIEFALQQRGDDGEWGERILPRGRYMPAYGDATSWLSSTPISVSLELESVTPEVTVISGEGNEEVDEAAISPRLGSGAGAGGVEFEAAYDPASSAVSSYLKLHSDGPLLLEVSCVAGQRGVGLSGIPDEAEEQLSFNLGGQDSSVRWSSGAFDVERVIRRLTDATTLTIGGGSLAESTFDLSSLFSTPIQANLDQCGNYTEPAWTPVTEAQNGRVGDDVGYALGYSDRRGLGLESVTSIHIDRKLGIQCFSGIPRSSWVQSYTWPGSDLPTGTYTARIQADGVSQDGEWEFTKYTDDGPLHISRESLDAYHELLKSASEVEISFDGWPQAKQEIDLSQVFTTPVQANIDNCGAPLWTDANDYVPIVNSQAYGTLSYEARMQEDTVFTNVSKVQGTEELAHLNVQIHCNRGSETNFVVGNLPPLEPGQYEVSIAIGDGDAVRSLWYSYQSIHDTEVTSSVSTTPSPQMLALLRLATTVTVEVHDTDLGPVSFDLDGIFDTPVQENFDNCGFYVPGETRMLPPPFVTGGQDVVDGATRHWNRQLTSAGGALVFVFLWAAEDAESRDTHFALSCSEAGPGVFLVSEHLADLTSDTITVDWQVDDGSEQSDTWDVWDFGGTLWLQPGSARAMIEAMRAGESLDITFQSAPAISRVYSLSAMFSTPIQEAIDECINAEVVGTSTSVEIQPRVGDVLRYQALRIGGADAVSTSLGLAVLDDAAPDWAGYSSRLVVTCAGSKPGIEITGIGLVGGAVIEEDTVEVTWRVGSGTPQTGTWDVRPFGHSYAISPPDDASVLAAISGAEEFSVSVASDPVFTQTYELSDNGFWDTPVQPNLDQCAGEVADQ